MKRSISEMKHLEQAERRSFGTGTGRNGAFARFRLILIAMALTLATCFTAHAQVNSGSTGADGALDFSTITITTNIVTDMHDHASGIYNYTHVNIPTNVTLMFIPNANNTPVTWLVQSNCEIDGTVNVSGQSATNGNIGGLGGVGGYNGGSGGNGGSSPGQGPGGGSTGSGSYATLGGSGADYWGTTFTPGAIYGNSFILPLLGGSGGAGINTPHGASYGGAGGGGAILIAAPNQIVVNGSILANGGNGQYQGNGDASGSGSGGAIRLVAQSLTGIGSLSAGGGSQIYNTYNYPFTYGGPGRVRLDVLQNNFAGNISGISSQGFQPIIIPVAGQGVQLSIANVAGASVSATPTGQLVSPDAIISGQQPNPISVLVNCSNLPLNSPVTVTVKPANGSPVSAVGFNSTGTLASSTVTVSLVMPHGGGIIYATAATGN